MKPSLYLLIVFGLGLQAGHAQEKTTTVTTSNGKLEGLVEASGIRAFKGVPYAQPPVGDLRFREPQPVQPWKGVRKAHVFGPKAMQLPIYSDMQFRSNGMSEDCLYLNVWTPASSGERLPVLVYFYGGGFMAGDGSEYRYDGENMATRGIVTVTVNYRLGIFGLLSHPDLTKESPHHSSGNYGLLDQHQALVWVQQNIAAFGGDPGRVTIGGESAGATSVCAQVASPLSKGLFAGAIGESGSLLGNARTADLAEGEKAGLAFSAKLGNKSLADLRAMPAQELLEAASKEKKFPYVVDGYFFPESPSALFAEGKEMHVALLAGWNSAESTYGVLLGKDEPTVENYQKAIRKIYGDKADGILAQYKASSPEEVKKVGTELALERSIGYNMWKWIDLQSKTGKPVYRYLYTHPRPPEVGKTGYEEPPMGAGHSWEIEYALGNLHTNKVYAWTADDDKVSQTMQTYFANFIKTGNPNKGPSAVALPVWEPMTEAKPAVMVIDVQSHGEISQHEGRYALWNTMPQ